MAHYVHEIMSTELFQVREGESVANTLLGILSLNITAAPVLSDEGRPVGMISLRDLIGERGASTVRDRMSTPVRTIHQDQTVTDAGRELSDRGLHRLVVVDDDGRAVGMVSALDVIRALMGIPVSHPQALPHRDERGLTWSDPSTLDQEHLGQAPDGPGVFVLIHGGIARPEIPVWAEGAANVRTRLAELLSVPQDGDPQLSHLLKHELAHLRFRAATVADPRARADALRRARDQVASASGHPSRKG